MGGFGLFVAVAEAAGQQTIEAAAHHGQASAASRLKLGVAS
jgi:hypothetical protein